MQPGLGKEFHFEFAILKELVPGRLPERAYIGSVVHTI